MKTVARINDFFSVCILLKVMKGILEVISYDSLVSVTGWIFGFPKTFSFVKSYLSLINTSRKYTSCLHPIATFECAQLQNKWLLIICNIRFSKSQCEYSYPYLEIHTYTP